MNSYPNITQQKTAEINRLKNKVVASTKKVEVSRAAYDAAVIKSTLLDQLLQEAQARLLTVTNELYQSSKAVQNVDSLKDSDEEARANVRETQELINKLIAQVQAVVTSTLNAASVIVEMSRLITDRKASNPLISSDLVSRAQAAVVAANRAVDLVINTLTSVINALSAAKQAQDTAKIVKSCVEMLRTRLVNSGGMGIEEPIKQNVEEQYNKARESENTIQNAAKDAKDQEIGANDILTSATNELQKDQAALAAAEAAVGSN